CNHERTSQSIRTWPYSYAHVFVGFSGCRPRNAANAGKNRESNSSAVPARVLGKRQDLRFSGTEILKLTLTGMIPSTLVSASGLSLVRVVLLAQLQPDRGAGQFKCISQRVQQISLVCIGYSICTGAEHNKARRPAFLLCDVVETQQTARHRRWRVGTDRMLEPAVQCACRNAPVPYLIGINDGLHQSVEALTRKPGDGHQWHALELGELRIGLFAEFADGARCFALQIPFVDRNDDSAAFLLTPIGDALILFLECIFDVEQHHHDFSKAHRTECVGN